VRSRRSRQRALSGKPRRRHSAPECLQERRIINLLRKTYTRSVTAGRIVEGPPKTTSGARTIVLDPATVVTLRQWRHEQLQEYVRLGVRPKAYVFTGIDGRPLWPQHITARFRDLCDEAGLPRIGVHGLRHSAATWLMAEGQNPKVVAQRLGHANPSITISLYSHVTPAHDRAAAEALAAAFGGNP
jgi:integrase